MKQNIGTLKRQIDRCRFLFDTVRYCSNRYSWITPEFYRFFIRSIVFFHKERFLPEELYQCGIAAGPLQPECLQQYCSRKKLTRLQSKINPQGTAEMTEDKALFYRLCRSADLPAPETYAVFYQNASGMGAGNRVITGKEEWCRYIENELPDRFFIKPCRGVYGKGIKALQRNGEGFVDHEGCRCSPADIYDTMAKHMRFSAFILQELLENHPDIIRLSGARGLQTVRLTTLIDRQGQFHLLYALLKPIVGNNIIDNHDNGRTGNLTNQIDLAHGTLHSAKTMTDDGTGIRTFEYHPETKVRFEGFKLPLWDETCELARKAAHAFLPIRTIGWDIGLTPAGPVIVEGNSWWDPPNVSSSIKSIMPHLLANC